MKISVLPFLEHPLFHQPLHFNVENLILPSFWEKGSLVLSCSSLRLSPVQQFDSRYFLARQALSNCENELFSTLVHNFLFFCLYFLRGMKKKSNTLTRISPFPLKQLMKLTLNSTSKSKRLYILMGKNLT